MDLEQQRLSAERSPLQLKGLTLLVVDDNIDTRTLFAFILEDCGAEVIAVPSAEEGLEAVKRAQPDLLISDINLSGADGYSLIRSIRALDPDQGGSVPAIAVTGAVSDASLDASIDEFQLYLLKPVEPDELINAVASLTQKSS